MILIHGGSGFIGQHVAKALLSRGADVVVTSSRGHAPAFLADEIAARRVYVEQVDVTDAAAVAGVTEKYKPDTVVDLTGHPPKALAPGKDVLFRSGALVNILEAARLSAVSRVVLMSSMDAYWGLGPDAVPFHEDATVPLLEQDDHYIVQSWAKKALEVIGNLYRRQYGMDIVFVRASGVYGPLYRTFLNVPSRIARAAAKGTIEFGPQTGGLPFAEDGYDQVYVKDMAEGMALVTTSLTLRFPVYNIGSGEAPTYQCFVDAASEAAPGFGLRLPSRLESAGPVASGPLDGLWQDISRAKQELGYSPRYSVRHAIAEYVDWLRRHDR
ncbi:MAG TPA: NAD(P)-dependent oxidoreductase [Phenylobacterium sp.]|uniref:NAD-dependent epimerase/dehydratase family protein n=1 Tax=Phenylobacterium sp. TaxID=1871053 RepID=UPI002B472576|nr:NAD(P)-dependent oxidoreductase [Phenylobacterium sp.]HKR90199.1 NAD(P)-dependent oxidoreductase [Phenylobacterium sp.]